MPLLRNFNAMVRNKILPAMMPIFIKYIGKNLNCSMLVPLNSYSFSGERSGMLAVLLIMHKGLESVQTYCQWRTILLHFGRNNFSWLFEEVRRIGIRSYLYDSF